MELSPVAAVSVQLFFRDTELNVSGPIQISLTLPDNCGLQTSNIIPAWLYNQTTGEWKSLSYMQLTTMFFIESGKEVMMIVWLLVETFKNFEKKRKKE